MIYDVNYSCFDYLKPNIYYFVFSQNSEAMVSIDMPAGPFEVLVIADKYASPVHIAADLLSQVTLLIKFRGSDLCI